MENDKFEGDYRWSDEESSPKRLMPIGRDNTDINNQEQIITNTRNLREKNIEYMSNNSENSEHKELSEELENLDNLENSEKSENSEYKGDSAQLEKSENLDKLEKLEKLEKSKKLEKEEPIITKSDIKSVIKLLEKIAEGVIEIQGMKPYTYDDKGRETTRRGRAHIYKFLEYYDVVNTIKRVGNEDPNDFDSPIYNREKIFEVLERYSDILHVINGGTKPLFAIVSHGGSTNFSKESIIFPGEVKDFYNVYELRLRSSEVGLQYRVTEYEIMSVSQTSLIPIELAALHDVDLPEKNTNWLETDIIPLVTPTTIRVEVAVSQSGIFSAAITREGNTQIVDFNVTSGPELIEDGLYTFEIIVSNGDSVNFRYSTDDGKIKILRVEEIEAATA